MRDGDIFDLVVVGGGIGGLTLATVIARASKSVLLFEWTEGCGYCDVGNGGAGGRLHGFDRVLQRDDRIVLNEVYLHTLPRGPEASTRRGASWAASHSNSRLQEQR